MRMRIWITLLLVVMSALGCTRTPPEQALREQVELLQRHIDERDASGIDALLADDFIGSSGMDRRDARRLAAAMFLRYRQVGVRFGPLQVQLNRQTHATVRFTAAASGGSGGLLPQDAQVYDVTTGWRLDDDEDQWLMTNAQWVAEL